MSLVSLTPHGQAPTWAHDKMWLCGAILRDTGCFKNRSRLPARETLARVSRADPESSIRLGGFKKTYLAYLNIH